MSVTPNFKYEEFVPQWVIRQGIPPAWVLDPRLPNLAQRIRDRFGAPMTINNWHRGGSRTHSGFRGPHTSVGAPLSQHRFGRAIDFLIEGYTPDEIREDIKKNYDIYRHWGLTTIEGGEFAPTWVHADIRTTDSSELLIVSP